MALGVRLGDLALPSVDRRKILGGVLAAVAAIGVLQLTKPPERFPVLVAGADLQAGRPLGEMDVDVRYVESVAGMVEGDSVGELADWSLRLPVSEGEPLVISMMRPPELVAFPNVMALSLDGSHALHGQIAAGDRIDIYVTRSESVGTPSTTALLASDVYVVEASVSESSIDRGLVQILLAVDDDLAALLASASNEAVIDLVRVAS